MTKLSKIAVLPIYPTMIVGDEIILPIKNNAIAFNGILYKLHHTYMLSKLIDGKAHLYCILFVGEGFLDMAEIPFI